MEVSIWNKQSELSIQELDTDEVCKDINLKAGKLPLLLDVQSQQHTSCHTAQSYETAIVLKGTRIVSDYVFIYCMYIDDAGSNKVGE